MVLEPATFGLESGTQSVHSTLEQNIKTPQWTLVESSLKMPFSLHFSTKSRTNCVHRCATEKAISAAKVSCACKSLVPFVRVSFFQGKTWSLLFWRRKMYYRLGCETLVQITTHWQVTGVSSFKNIRARKSPRPFSLHFLQSKFSRYPTHPPTHTTTHPPRSLRQSGGHAVLKRRRPWTNEGNSPWEGRAVPLQLSAVVRPWPELVSVWFWSWCRVSGPVVPAAFPSSSVESER